MTGLVAIRSEPLTLDEVVSAVSRPEAGAVVSFSGVVRNHADGRTVTLLEYEAYPSMAEKEMLRILQAIEAESTEVRLAVLHRVGALQVGELAVVCAASAPHREQAFEACHRCIDRIKASVPIWKREHGPDGPYWVGWHDARCVHEGHDHANHHHSGSSGHHHGTSAARSMQAPLSGLRVGVLTVSDSRSARTDESGRVARALLSGAGAQVVVSHIVRDEPAEITDWVRAQARAVDALVITGGTGITLRDQTIEALCPLFTRTLDGFGEAFRRASFEQIGPRAVLSRATAGVVGACLVFSLPGSPHAVELGVKELVIPVLPHGVAMLRGANSHHHAEHAHEG